MTKVKLLFISTLLLAFGCKKEPVKKTFSDQITQFSTIKYAQGFKVVKNKGYRVLEIYNPWPNANKTLRYVLLNAHQEAPTHLADAQILRLPLQKVVVTSTTHIPGLELLDAEDALIGFPGTHYISSPKTRARIAKNKIRDMGSDEGLNTEMLLDLHPDAVIAYSMEGTGKNLQTLQKSGIPIIYNGDWIEASPLAKAEWLKFFGVLFQKEKKADSIFSAIEINYNKAIALAKEVKEQPTVLSGVLTKDLWYLPHGSSSEAQLLNDANANYLWTETKGAGSLKLSFEVVLEKAQDADLWINPFYYTSLDQLEKANPHHNKFKAFQEKKVYSFAKVTGETGGVLYYEMGISRPDLVLKDLIKICHPQLLPHYKMHFFSPLK